jgi:error-prone DNA polymerase
MPRYAELQVASNFSFLRGASHPAELVAQAKMLGLAAIAVTDRNTLAGIVRAHAAAKKAGIRLVIGARLDFTDGPSLLALPQDRAAYGRLAQLLTDGKRRAPKGECHLGQADLLAHGDGQQLIALPPEAPDDAAFAAWLQALARRFPGAVHLAAHCLYRGDDARRLHRLGELAARAGVPLVATNDVHAHVPARRALQDVLTCVREGCTLAEAGFRLHANAERHLKSAEEMTRLFRRRPDAVEQSLAIVERCGFSLDELRYEYPAEPVPEGRTPQEELERLAWLHAPERYPDGIPDKIRALIEKELQLIAKLDYARYFLTVHDIVKYARSRDILCQGRGSAANSAVCYMLGITAVDPDKVDLLFERFVSDERKEPPDIDVDFEHERREEVIQHIYEKYGRDRAGIVATVISYRPKSAIRDVGKVLGLSADAIGILSKTLWGWGRDGIQEDYVREAGMDPDDPNLQRALTLAQELIGFPRHLSQHTGGFVITRGRLSEVVPIENAAMEDRTVIEWDKDDLDELQMLKIDVLALGMLTCIAKGLDLLRRHYGIDRKLYEVAHDEDPRIYEMLSRADTIGVFQVESRAQMSMLPRLRPKEFYDLVVEVAIVRPGPIQGDMVHPYLKQRQSKEPPTFPSEELREVLSKTFGVPLFQEQAMRIAIVAAGFTPAEANELRRAMATFRRVGTIGTLKDRFIDGMVARRYERDFAERCFRQIEGFGDYGFPESHAASFALLVYVSAWLKCYYPALFACAILNSQPMGFYAPAQLVRDARDHGVEVRPVDVNHSDWDCTLEPILEKPNRLSLVHPPHPAPAKLGLTPSLSLHNPLPPLGEEGRVRGAADDYPISAPDKTRDIPRFALRLGFRQIKGFRKEDAERLMSARRQGDFATLQEVWQRLDVDRRMLGKLAQGDAMGSTGLNRRAAEWAAMSYEPASLPLFAAAEAADGALVTEPPVALPAMSLGEEVTEDYRHLHLSLKRHPVALLRDTLARRGIIQTRRLKELPDGKRVDVAGIVLIRQQPGTAKGVIFVTIEDETGVANIIVWRHVFTRFRPAVIGSRLLGVRGRVQRDESGEVIHVVAERVTDLSNHLATLAQSPLPFETAPSRADEARHPPGDDRRGTHRRVVLPASRDFR